MSTAYLKLLASPEADFMSKFFQQTRSCEEIAAVDCESAIRIQRRWRGFRDRKYLALLTANATTIQRMYRGHLGRLRFLSALRHRSEQASRSFYDCMATRIQKVMRGFLSRKFAQNIYARRAYIGAVADRGTELVRVSEENLEKQIIAADAEAVERRAAKFEHLTQNIHHLVGTKAIPSVFKSKFGSQFDATAFDIPMEDHIKEAFANRQASLRKMRSNIFHPQRTNHQQQQQQQEPLPSQSSQQQPSHPHSYLRSSASSALDGPSPPLSSNPSLPQSGSVSRASRPTSAQRLAPIQGGVHASSSSPVPISVSSASNRPLSSASNFSNESTVSSSIAPFFQSTKHQPVDATQKLPSLRTTSGASATPSGRTLSAAQLYNSKMTAFSPDIEEEKQQLPLALALGGHVSTTPTGSRKSLGLAATRAIGPSAAGTAAATATSAISPDGKRKWSQPTKPNIQRADA